MAKKDSKTFEEFLLAHKEHTQRTKLSGPTNFAQLFDEAVKIEQTRKEENAPL